MKNGINQNVKISNESVCVCVPWIWVRLYRFTVTSIFFSYFLCMYTVGYRVNKNCLCCVRHLHWSGIIVSNKANEGAGMRRWRRLEGFFCSFIWKTDHIHNQTYYEKKKLHDFTTHTPFLSHFVSLDILNGY